MSTRHKLAALQRRFSGIYGVAARDLETKQQILRNAREVFPAASSIKVAIMVELFRQVEAGLIDLETALTYRATDRVGGSGILRELTLGVALPIRDLLTLMIIVSDNTATNMLIDVIGGASPVNETMQALGYPDLILHRKISFDSDDPLASGTPRAFCDLLTAMARGEVVSEGASRAMVAVMKRQHFTDRIARYLPYESDRFEEDPEHHLGVATKSGTVRGVRNDVGIVFPPARRPYVIAVMTRDCADERSWSENEGTLAVARVSRIVYDNFVGRPVPPATAGASPS